MALVKFLWVVSGILLGSLQHASGFGLGITSKPRTLIVRGRIPTRICSGQTRVLGQGMIAPCGGDLSKGQGARRGAMVMMAKRKRREVQNTNFREGMNYITVQEDYKVCDIDDDPSLPEVMTVCAAADERKAEGVKAIRVAHLTAVTDYMIILEGKSRPQNQAISQNIEEKMEERHGRVPKIQGTPESGWILLDYGDMIVHIMTPKSRTYYDLDSFWANGNIVEVDHVLTPNIVNAVPVVDEDPFWS